MSSVWCLILRWAVCFFKKKKRWSALWVLHLLTDSGLIVHATLCQRLRKTDSNCTTFRLIYVSTGREVRGAKNNLESKLFFFFLFLSCSDNKLSKFERLQRAAPPSTRNRQTLLSAAVSAGDAPHIPRLPKAVVRPGWAPTGGSRVMGEFLGRSPGTSKVPGAAGGLPWRTGRTESKDCAGIDKNHISTFPRLTPSTHLMDLGVRPWVTLQNQILSNLEPTDFIWCKLFFCKIKPVLQSSRGFCGWFSHHTWPRHQQPLAAAKQGKVQVWESSLSKLGIKINLLRGDRWEQ